MGKRGTAGAKLEKPHPRPPTRQELRAAMGRGRRKGGNTEAGGKKKASDTLGVRDDNRGPEASGVDHDSLRVGDEAGGCKASGVVENPWGYHHGVDGGVYLPQCNNTPRVTELTWRDKTPVVTTEGASAPREDERGRGGDNPPPPTTQATGAQGDGKTMGGPMTAAKSLPQRGTATGNNSTDTPLSHTDRTNGARPKHSALARREYGLLALIGPTVDPDDAGEPRSAASYGATGEQDRRDLEEGVET